MSAISTVQSFNLDIHAVIQISGITRKATSNKSKVGQELKTELAGGWVLKTVLPADNALFTDEETTVRVSLCKPSNVTVSYGNEATNIATTYVDVKVMRLLVDRIICQTHLRLDLSQSSWSGAFSWAKSWTYNSDVRRDDGFRLQIDFPSTQRPSVFHPLVLQSFSKLALGSQINDIKFLAFSRRPGIIRKGTQSPLPIYASSAFLINQSEYFRTICGGLEFSEGKDVSFDEPPPETDIDDYDYDSDSDMGYITEDEDERICLGDLETPEEPQVAGKVAAATTSNAKDKHVLHGQIGKVIMIKDTAYVTWRAMLFFLCTSRIAFAPLSSLKKAHLCSRTDFERQNGFPPKASAKSIYRVADKIGLTDLSALALRNIRAQLTADNVMVELFSNFTSRYPEVKDMELQFALEHWGEIRASSGLRNKIADIASGEHPECVETLTTLLSRMLPTIQDI